MNGLNLSKLCGQEFDIKSRNSEQVDMSLIINWVTKGEHSHLLKVITWGTMSPTINYYYDDERNRSLAPN